MHRTSQRVLRILDGSPGALGGYQRGQSLVELLLITPLLIIMVAGIIEIGWYANHVLILLEVSRVGARQATLFTGENGYQSWNNAGSIHPIAYKFTNGFNTASTSMDDFPGTTGALYAIGSPAGVPPIESANARDCSKSGQGFYSSVACTMINSLDPLTMKGRSPTSSDIIAKRIRQDYGTPTLIGLENQGGRLWFTYKYTELYPYPDDIVVSVFSLQAINNVANRDDPALNLKSDPTTYARSYNFGARFPRGYQVVVVGRYPTNANECNVTFTPTLGPSANPSTTQLALAENYLQRVITLGGADYDYGQRSWESGTTLSNMTAPSKIIGTFQTGLYNAADPTTYKFRDPFDYYIVNDKQDLDAASKPLELAGVDVGAEYQRGFVYTGQHVVNSILNQNTGLQLFCIGSEWSDQRVQDTVNSPAFLQKGVNMPPNGDPNDPGAAAWQAGVGNVSAYNEWQARAKFLPSQGAVLVEMFWRHDILLDFPLMAPITRLMEGAGGPNNIVISVWAVFPLPSAEPNMNFGFPPSP